MKARGSRSLIGGRRIGVTLAAAGFAAGILVGPGVATAAMRALDVFVTNTASDPVVTREAAHRFSVFVRRQTGNGTSPACASVPLPAGTVVIEHVDTDFAIDVRSYLTVTANVQTPAGIGRTTALVSFAGVPLNLPEFQGEAEALTDALVVYDGDTGTLGDLWTTADEPVHVCSQDAEADAGSSGSITVSGYVQP